MTSGDFTPGVGLEPWQQGVILGFLIAANNLPEDEFVRWQKAFFRATPDKLRAFGKMTLKALDDV